LALGEVKYFSRGRSIDSGNLNKKWPGTHKKTNSDRRALFFLARPHTEKSAQQVQKTKQGTKPAFGRGEHKINPQLPARRKEI
jgi:hypothetical protein